MATFALPFNAAFVTILTDIAVLPIDGLAANRTKSDFCSPESLLSKSINPVVKPVMVFWFAALSSILLKLDNKTSFIGENPSLCLP